MKIRKIQQPAPYGASIKDSYSESLTDTYSCNYINEATQEIYDGTERVIGKWFGKPLYRKTFIETKTANTLNIDVASLNVDDGWVDTTNSYLKGGGNEYKAINTTESSPTYFVNASYQKANNKIVVNGNNSSYYTGTCVITFKYTKTTD